MCIRQIGMKSKQNPTAAGAPAVVGTVHSPRGLETAAGLRPSDGLGFVEVRADVFAGGTGELAEAMSAIRLPVLLTVRHPTEGGEGRLTVARRRALFEALLGPADAVDLELRSLPVMEGVLREVRKRGLLTIVSSHNFRRTPSLRELREVVRRGFAGGADVVKIATWLRGPHDLAVLLQLQSSTEQPLATMGMGPLGKVSRLALAAAGSRLNYGYLDKPRVEGQWPAAQLASLLKEVVP